MIVINCYFKIVKSTYIQGNRAVVWILSTRDKMFGPHSLPKLVLPVSLPNTRATSHTCDYMYFSFLINILINLKTHFLVTLATFQMLNSCIWLCYWPVQMQNVPTATTDRDALNDSPMAVADDRILIQRSGISHAIRICQRRRIHNNFMLKIFLGNLSSKHKVI